MIRFKNTGLGFLAAALVACGGTDTVTPPTPPHLAIVAGDNQTGIVGRMLPVQIKVSVTTAGGDPIAGQVVSFTVTSGGGTVSSASVGTDVLGQTAVDWTLGSDTGPQSVLASVEWKVGSGEGDLVKFGVSFTATANPPPPPASTPQPVILHYDGAAWSVAVEKQSSQPVVLNSIWGASASNIYAGGSLCGQAMTMKYDGTSWTQDLQECGGVFSRSVVSIWGTSASSVFYIVRNSPAPRSPGASLYVFDGQGTWSPNYNHFCSPPPGCDPYLNAGWSGAPDFVSAVGDSGFVVHYDGAAWTEQARGTTRNLNAVWGSGTGGAAAIFAVGDTGTIVSFDGSAWHPVASGTTQPLYGIWGTSASDVFAVGGGGTILHYDGTTWTAQSSGSTQTLRGVWGTSGTSVFVVGDAGTVLRYDGTSWVALAATTSIDLRGVWGSSATNVFAVGHPR